MAIDGLSMDCWAHVLARVTSVKDMGNCARVCKAWTSIIENNNDVWKVCALQKVLGKSVWENFVGVDVGEQPCYRIDGQPIPWREACKLQREPSLFEAKKGPMIEVDVLVPATINGKPTTINRVVEVFAHAPSPVALNKYINSEVLEQHGETPVTESRIVRVTYTVDEETRRQEANRRVAIIVSKGKGFYEPIKAITHFIYTGLAKQVGAPYGYGQDPWTFTQYEETLKSEGREWPLLGGGYQETTSGAPGGLTVSFDDGCVSVNDGAGAQRDF